jgi:hypothetical protein
MKTLLNLLVLTALLAAQSVCAHIASNGFLTLNVEGSSRLNGHIELAVRDVELAVGLDTNGDGKVTWGEVRAHEREIVNYVVRHLGIDSDRPVGTCEVRGGALEVNERVDGNYLWVPLGLVCARSLDAIAIDYRMMQGIDPSHRGLLVVSAYGATQPGVLIPGAGPTVISLGHVTWLTTVAEYFKVGVWHIWSGIDHLLFLLSLLLPAVLRRADGRWEAAPLARPAFINILKVVTAFTLAHSVTLSLAAFDVVHLPSRLTESVIAASIIIAALNNVFPRVTEGRWRIAFAFGLLHGFGFASVLAEMGLPPGARLISLVAFNLGVEAGQLAVVLAAMPLAYWLRATRFYRNAVLNWGSCAIAGLALVWLVQRATGY